MKRQKYTIPQKITVLNEVILDSMTEKHADAIVKNFTDSSIQILEADFGFAWWKFSTSDEYKLAYKSQGTPYEPFMPRKKANHYTAIKKKRPIFDSNVTGENYEASDISPYMKSFVIIPIYHKKNIYGSLTLCYKKRHIFSEEELALSQAIGHATAQAITINRLVQTDILLAQEKLKTEFIGNATHELGTPLAIMRGKVDLALLNKKNLPYALRTLREINAEIKILSEILKDLVLLTSPNEDISQLINPVPVNIIKLIEGLAKRLKIVAGEKNIKITIKNNGLGDVFVLGDEKCLEKLFINLLKNAISYGKKNGSIVIDINKEPRSVKIKISDNGMGISKEDLPKIFERFFRGDKAHTHGHNENHSGLGLAIVQWATELHGGTIKAKSVNGKGSAFTVTLPTVLNLSSQPRSI